MKKYFWGSLYLILLLTSCHKDEPLYPAPTLAEGLQTQTFEMGETYSQQLYFDFETQNIKGNDFGKWDIGFACNNEPHVIICAGKNVQFSAAELNQTDFNKLHTIDVKQLQWRFDHPEGLLDSMAISNCFVRTQEGYKGKEGQVFIIDLGIDSVKNQRFVKLQFLSVVGGIYQFKWGYVFDSLFKTQIVQIQTQPEYNYIYYSFSNQNVVENEVLKKQNWDLVFTTYKEDIPDENGKIFPYIIRGAIINSGKISVAQIDGSLDFSQFKYNDALKISYNKKWNEIGYDWKSFDRNSGKYSIVANRFYVIKTDKGNFFKLRFIDFYNDQGRKGFPKIAWELLKS